MEIQNSITIVEANGQSPATSYWGWARVSCSKRVSKEKDKVLKGEWKQYQYMCCVCIGNNSCICLKDSLHSSIDICREVQTNLGSIAEEGKYRKSLFVVRSFC